MEHEILAVIGGSFKCACSVGGKVRGGDRIGTIQQFGTSVPVTTPCDGEVKWIRSNGIVRSHEKLCRIARTVLAFAAEDGDVSGDDALPQPPEPVGEG